MSQHTDKCLKISIRFQGTNYFGWQVQPNHKTVQGELNKALSEIYKLENVKTIGSGRTDTGVHSREHIVKFTPPFDIKNEALKKGLNSILPSDIEVVKVEDCSLDFLPTNDAKSRTYFYLFSNLDHQEVMMENMMANTNFNLDLKLMEKACKAFIGTHNFAGFMCTGSDVNSTVRTIFSCDIEFINTDSFHGIVPAHYKITISGNGFLKQMVRLIVGTIWEVGRGKVAINAIRQELENPGTRKLAPVAPAQGLYKASVTY